MKPVFHRDGRVSLDGKVVGKCDLSGADWACKPLWVLKLNNGETHLAETRRHLEWRIVAAAKEAS